jgi:SIR2-like protein
MDTSPLDASPPGHQRTATQLAVLQGVYDHFVANSEWPLAWQFELALQHHFGPEFSLERVCLELGSHSVSTSWPNDPHGRVQLTLRGVAEVAPDSELIEHFLAAARLAYKLYAGRTSPEARLDEGQLAAELSLDASAAKRTAALFATEHELWRGGATGGPGPSFFVLSRFAARLRDVGSFSDYIGRKEAHLAQERETAMARSQRALPPKGSTKTPRVRGQRDEAGAGRVALLIGAGASKPLGLPVMENLLSPEFITRLGDNNVRRWVFDMAANWSFDTARNSIDFERLYTAVDALSTVTTDDLASIPFAPQRDGRVFSFLQNGSAVYQGSVDHVRDIASQVREQLRREVHDRLGIVDPGKAATLYNPLFELLIRDPRSRSLSVFTTNYDEAIEVAWQTKRLSGFSSLVNGFRAQAGRNRVFDPSAFKRGSRHGVTLMLYKMHGSLNWLNRDGVVMESPGTHYLGSDTHRGVNAVIYPLRKHALDEEPFKTCFDRFKLTLKKVHTLVVVGSSLRDLHIQRALVDALSARGNTARPIRVVVVDPNAHEVASRLGPPGENSASVAIPAGLGTAEATAKLESVIGGGRELKGSP